MLKASLFRRYPLSLGQLDPAYLFLLGQRFFAPLFFGFHPGLFLGHSSGFSELSLTSVFLLRQDLFALLLFSGHPGLFSFQVGLLLREKGRLFPAGLFGRHPSPLFIGGHPLGFGQLRLKILLSLLLLLQRL